MKKALKRGSFDVLFTDCSNYKPVLKLLEQRKVRLVEYIHYPFEACYSDRLRGTLFYWKNDPYYRERYGSFPMNIYWELFLKLYKLTARSNPFEVCDLVLCNSKWTAKLVRELYNEDPLVLNPPISPSVKVSDKPPSFHERKDVVVMVGRFSEEKRYHWVVDQVAPVLQKYNIRIVIIGGTGTRTSNMYFERVRTLIEKRGLKNVQLIRDAPREVIDYWLSRAKVFLHACINEHFGLAPGEALAHGTPIVVHRSGGTWTDIAEEGRAGLGYETAEECIENILKLITDEKLWNAYSQKGLRKARQLTIEKFGENLREVLRKLGLV